MDFSLLWPHWLSSSLGNSEVCNCREVVYYICQFANQIENFKMKLATLVPTKLVNSELAFFKGKTILSSEWFSLKLFCELVRKIYKMAEFRFIFAVRSRHVKRMPLFQLWLQI